MILLLKSRIPHTYCCTQVHRVDLDVLESLLPSVAHGNIKRYATSTEATQHTLRLLFEASQLTVQYLLYVQDRLAADSKRHKVRHSFFFLFCVYWIELPSFILHFGVIGKCRCLAVQDQGARSHGGAASTRCRGG